MKSVNCPLCPAQAFFKHREAVNSRRYAKYVCVSGHECWLSAALMEIRSLQALLEKTKDHVMSPEEKEAQRQSWIQGEMGMGTDADEAKERGRISCFKLGLDV